MKILVTGANGQIGCEITQLALQQNHVLFACAKDQLDITNRSSTEHTLAAYAPDVVINTAAYTSVDRAEEEQTLAYAVNCKGIKNLALACQKHHIPLLHLSTDYIFSGDQHIPYLEEDTPAPLNIYGKSKWEGEKILREIHDQYIILRTSWIFSPFAHNFVKTMLTLARQRKNLAVVHDQIGCPTSAVSVARVLLTLAQRIHEGKQQWGTYHYCSSHPVSWFTFAEEIIRIGRTFFPLIVETLSPLSSKEYPTKATRPLYSVLNTQKLKKIYNIEPCQWETELTKVIPEMFQEII